MKKRTSLWIMTLCLFANLAFANYAHQVYTNNYQIGKKTESYSSVRIYENEHSINKNTDAYRCDGCFKLKTYNTTDSYEKGYQNSWERLEQEPN